MLKYLNGILTKTIKIFEFDTLRLKTLKWKIIRIFLHFIYEKNINLHIFLILIIYIKPLFSNTLK